MHHSPSGDGTAILHLKCAWAINLLTMHALCTQITLLHRNGCVHKGRQSICGTHPYLPLRILLLVTTLIYKDTLTINDLLPYDDLVPHLKIAR